MARIAKIVVVDGCGRQLVALRAARRMNLAEQSAAEAYLGKPVILDANLLLLHWCASFDPELYSTHSSGLNSFESDDY